MVDLSLTRTAWEIMFTTDASANPLLGVGAYCLGHWFSVQWEPRYIQDCRPSIEYLELYGVAAALVVWGHLLTNQRLVLFCDNTTVVAMINNTASSCANCMDLLRIIMLDNLLNNHRIFAKYISTRDNFLSDSLSWLQMNRFWVAAPEGTDRFPTKISDKVWPASKVWKLH